MSICCLITLRGKSRSSFVAGKYLSACKQFLHGRQCGSAQSNQMLIMLVHSTFDARSCKQHLQVTIHHPCLEGWVSRAFGSLALWWWMWLWLLVASRGILWRQERSLGSSLVDIVTIHVQNVRTCLSSIRSFQPQGMCSSQFVSGWRKSEDSRSGD